MSENKRKEKTTHFGYQTVNKEDKTKKVGEVFTSVANNYDLGLIRDTFLARLCFYP